MMSSADVRQRRPQKSSAPVDDEKFKSDAEKSMFQGCLRPFLIAVTIFVIAPLVIFILIPSPIEALENILPEPQDLVGPLEPNNILQSSEKFYTGELLGPESLVMKGDHMYTGTSDGWLNDVHKGKVRRILKFGPGPCGGIKEENTCGRILGMRMDKDGSLVVIDCYFGLFRVNPKTGEYTTLVDSTKPVLDKGGKFFNDLDIGPDGKIYFTQTSTNWLRNELSMILLSAFKDGRLLMYDPKTKKVTELISDVLFLNGVQLTEDKTALLVVETGKHRILRYDLKSRKVTVWSDNLPGYPDNIRYHPATGTYWLGLAMFRQKGRSYIDALARRPWLRQQMSKVVNAPNYIYLYKLLHVADVFALALELDTEGNIIRSIQDRTGAVIGGVSEVERVGDKLYLGSFVAPYLAKLDTKLVYGDDAK